MLYSILKGLISVLTIASAIYWPQGTLLILGVALYLWFDLVRRENGLTWGEMAQKQD